MLDQRWQFTSQKPTEAASPSACQAQMESLRKSHRDDLSRVQRVACHTRMLFPMEKKPPTFCLGGRCFVVEEKKGQPYACIPFMYGNFNLHLP